MMAWWIRVLCGIGSWIVGAWGLSELARGYFLLTSPHRIETKDILQLLEVASGRVRLSRIGSALSPGAWLTALAIWLGFLAFG